MTIMNELYYQLRDWDATSIKKTVVVPNEYKWGKPTLTDLSLIPKLYKWFCENHKSGGFKNKADETSHRQAFILIIVSEYSPATLFDNKRMKKGLRMEIFNLFSLAAPCSISNDLKDAIDQFSLRKEFYEKALLLIKELDKYLTLEGLKEKTNTEEQ